MIFHLDKSARSPAAVRRAVGFDDLARAHPMHEIIVVWFNQDPDHAYAIALRIPKWKIAQKGWPFLVDRESRVLELAAPGAA